MQLRWEQVVRLKLKMRKWKSNRKLGDRGNSDTSWSSSSDQDSNYNLQTLKHLSASAPAMRTDLGKSEQGNFFMEPSSSKSRQKKFHRHFKAVPIEEKVLDYYSCALVGDILLQGFLYISENYFAFYSNVFGYVTKLLIPVTNVVNITKERTAKIFPNAVGIQTQSERHVFASLISRDTTYKLMLKVWAHKVKNSDVLIIPNPGDDTSGDIAIADDSSGDSCGSGNDSALEPSSCSPSPQSTPGIEKLLQHHHHHIKLPLQTANSHHIIPHNISQLHSAQIGDNNNINSLPNGPLTLLPNGAIASSVYLRHPYATRTTNAVPVTGGSINNSNNLEPSSTTLLKKNDPPKTKRSFGNSSHLLTLATALLVILFISAGVLLFRISNLQEKLTQRPTISGNSEQFYQDLLNWQNRLHSNSAEEIHQFIDSNLHQIVKVRESLEALSSLFMNGQHNSMMGDHPGSSSHLGNMRQER